MSDTDISLIQEKLLSRINEKMNRLNSLRPLPADAVKKLHEEMRLLHTYHSNAIEGNTLTLPETKLVLEEGITIGGKSLREHLEATNNARAFDLMENIGISLPFAMSHSFYQLGIFYILEAKAPPATQGSIPSWSM